MGHRTFKERWGGGKAGRVNGSKYCCRSIFYVNVFSTLFCMFYISLDWLFIYKQSLAVGQENCFLNNPQFSWTFYLDNYRYEQHQEGWKLKEGHLFNKINPLTEKARDPLIA